MARDEPPPQGDATRRQTDAARPDRSTWVEANAGSGKTRVLTDRVARLLLAGAAPETILCLTYTKAAASEMQNRLFRRLGGWAMLEDAPLAEALQELGAWPLPARPHGEAGDGLDAARRLFARAIEAPGGLKIQTIHAFCAGLLRRFPLEAGVSPQFAELDDRTLKQLAEEVMEAIADGPEAHRLDDLARYLSGDDRLWGMVASILTHREVFARPLDRAGAMALHGLPTELTEEHVLAGVFKGGEAGMIARLMPLLQAKGGNDAKAAEKLAPLLPLSPSMATLAVLEDVLLTGHGANSPFSPKIGAFPTKPTRAAMEPEDADVLEVLMLRVCAARPERLGLAAAGRTLALHRFAAILLPAIAARKSARGWLDFDDLIFKASDLLADRSVADWVLWKLDGDIDHILVDEAQDTSPVQWMLIGHLAQDLLSGGADDRPHTLFVVGDRKQSIYSFQGADPAEFDAMRARFGTGLADAGRPMASGALRHSFRSAPAILAAVDATFAGLAAGGLGDAPDHRAFHASRPGRVDLWPAVAPEKDEQAVTWPLPLDRITSRHHHARLADAIAGELRRLIDEGTALPDGAGGARPLTEGDVLILVRRRAVLFHELLRACKAAGLRVAGADRLSLGTALAAQDVLALLRFLALPEDDLSLATALRSPLFGWSEDALFRLAQPRRGVLWAALRRSPDHPGDLAMLRDLRGASDYERPFELIERILTRHGGRQRLLARLGPESEEAIDALLAQALAYEMAEVPSLTGFLAWIDAADAVIKRQPDAAGDALRIMTVHGAKGLEAPVVILPDCASTHPPPPPPLLRSADGPVIWPPPAAERTEIAQGAADAHTAREAAERDRLLYVAMTRAESWLIVAAGGGLGNAGDTWHDRVRVGLEALEAAAHDAPTGPGLRLSNGAWPVAADARAAVSQPAATALPDWALRRASAAPPRPALIAPSALGGAKALAGEAGEDTAAAMVRGNRLHLLLEHLPRFPAASWAAMAPTLLQGASGAAAPAEEDAELLAEATTVLTNPDLAFLFAPGTLAEVDLSAALAGLGGRMRGTIDRLVLMPGRVLAVDYKSNAVLPATAAAVPDGLLRQMGAYAAALGQIYPGRQIDTAILWTRSARLMPLPQEAVRAALALAEPAPAHLDALPPRP